MVRGGTSPSCYELQRALKGQRGPNGRPLCTWCRKEVPVGRRSWCSNECVEAYRLDHDWGLVRRRVLERDRGVCAHCGTDTVALKARMKRIRLWLYQRRHGKHRGNELYQIKDIDLYQFEERWAKKRCGIPAGRVNSDWWDADHIRPVCEGGTNDLANLRTLCIRCHQAETRTLAKRRSKRAIHDRAAELPLEFAEPEQPDLLDSTIW